MVVALCSSIEAMLSRPAEGLRGWTLCSGILYLVLNLGLEHNVAHD